jgi:hypothetical protein
VVLLHKDSLLRLLDSLVGKIRVVIEDNGILGRKFSLGFGVRDKRRLAAHTAV